MNAEGTHPRHLSSSILQHSSNMCGIVGYIGPKQATPILVAGLKRLEYRGYDSAGVAVFDGESLETRRAAGKIAKLEGALVADPVTGKVGIAHTRWATHGPPTERNAHPHLSSDETVAVVHNGIIENADVLRKQLITLGHTFRSDTDTETIAHLVQELYEESLEEAVTAALRKVEGTFGIAVVSPPLDEAGNSVRGQKAITDISNALKGNPYASTPR